MTVDPGPTAVTRPEELPIVATDVRLLVQVPPVAPSVSVVEDPVHIDVKPDMGVRAFTVIGKVMAQPVSGAVYVIRLVPKVMPVTMPVAAPTVSIAVLPVAQVPPPVASVSVALCPTHTVAGPDMADGSALIVIVVVRKQPVPRV